MIPYQFSTHVFLPIVLIRSQYCRSTVKHNLYLFVVGSSHSCQQLHVLASILAIIRLYSFLL